VLALLLTLLLSQFAVSAAAGVTGNASAGSPAPPGRVLSAQGVPDLIVQFGPDIAQAVRTRIEILLRASTGGRQTVVFTGSYSISGARAGCPILSFGDTQTTRNLIRKAELDSLGSEGFIVRSGVAGGHPTIVTDGNPPRPDRYRLGANIGASYGAYALLEELGFAFLHPLQPLVPERLALPGRRVNIVEKPYWPDRGIHIHTMHPLELTNLLNGWGKSGPEDEAGWRSMLGEWESFLDWSLANRQNCVEWVLLMAGSWQQFADGPVRQARLAELVGMAHDRGIGAGIDAPFALMQQHAWFMVRQQGSLPDELAQIRSRIDWLMGAGFDFLGGEMGTGEFASTDDVRFVEWMNEAARYLDENYAGKRLYMKIHCSTGQKAPHYTDPDTGQPLNYNFLAHYADPRVCIMPHTVQPYSLDDPAPTYGNTDFGYMREFMQEEAGAREVRWHPETAYWCTYDIDMPLFLPLYAERRLHDLRLIAADELAGRMGRGEHAGSRIQGQVFFSSGWEWGYWLNDVVAARAAWNPYPGAANDAEALKKLLAPVTRPFGGSAGKVRDLLIRTIQQEQRLLIDGRAGGSTPATVEKRNGQAYLEGWDSLDDLGDLVALIPFAKAIHAQPDKLQLVGLYNFHWFEAMPTYTEIQPLLRDMDSTLAGLSADFGALKPSITGRARSFYDELYDAAAVTALRAAQVSGLYDYVYAQDQTAEWRKGRLEAARRALDSAQLIVTRREAAYRVEPDRIAGWHYNPTAYPFGYLWTVRTLWYWWRDEGKAVDQPGRPGYMNVVSPIDQSIGENGLLDLTKLLRCLGDWLAPGLFEGFAAPCHEPKVPPYDFRNRP
jgi:hypothetical protein